MIPPFAGITAQGDSRAAPVKNFKGKNLCVVFFPKYAKPEIIHVDIIYFGKKENAQRKRWSLTHFDNNTNSQKIYKKVCQRIDKRVFHRVNKMLFKELRKNKFFFKKIMFRRWSFAEGVKEFAAQQEKFAAEECGVSSKILLTSEIAEKHWK